MTGTPSPQPGTPAKIRKPKRPTTKRHQADEAELRELASKQLETTRASAEKWRAGLAGLLAIVTGALFIKGKESVDEIASPWDEVLGVLIVLAIAATGWATFKALRASSGQPRATLTDEIAAAGGPSDYRLQLARRAADDLRHAQIAAFAGMAFLTAAVLVSWYGPDPDPDPPQLQVTVAGEKICGTSKGIVARRLRVDTSGGNRRSIPWSDVESVEVLAECEAAGD